MQNSLGRYWLESHPEHRDLLESWEFYLENQNPEPDFEEKLAPYINKELKVEDIKCFDPAMGVGISLFICLMYCMKFIARVAIWREKFQG